MINTIKNNKLSILLKKNISHTEVLNLTFLRKSPGLRVVKTPQNSQLAMYVKRPVRKKKIKLRIVNSLIQI